MLVNYNIIYSNNFIIYSGEKDFEILDNGGFLNSNFIKFGKIGMEYVKNDEKLMKCRFIESLLVNFFVSLYIFFEYFYVRFIV